MPACASINPWFLTEPTEPNMMLEWFTSFDGQNMETWFWSGWSQSQESDPCGPTGDLSHLSKMNWTTEQQQRWFDLIKVIGHRSPLWQRQKPTSSTKLSRNFAPTLDGLTRNFPREFLAIWWCTWPMFRYAKKIISSWWLIYIHIYCISHYIHSKSH